MFTLQVSVNEAAAQICRQIPAMLTRRDELFPLARQVVRDSGYQYSKGHSRYWVMQCERPLLSGIFPGPPSQYQTSCSTETRGPSSGWDSPRTAKRHSGDGWVESELQHCHMLHLTYESLISFRGLEIGDKTILMVKSRTEIKSSHFEKK